jgi:hypothetical protein
MMYPAVKLELHYKIIAYPDCPGIVTLISVRRVNKEATGFDILSCRPLETETTNIAEQDCIDYVPVSIGGYSRRLVGYYNDTQHRNSFEDEIITSIFDPEQVTNMDEDKLRMYLSTYNLAIQPARQSQIWRKNCESICNLLKGDIRTLFSSNGWNILEIMRFAQVTHKRNFPYLCGPKLFSYWIHVLERYTDARFNGRQHLTIAPDTHVIKATIKLGIISEELSNSYKIQKIVIDAWAGLLKGTGIVPIDMHTPLWLWSKGGFKEISDLIVQGNI